MYFLCGKRDYLKVNFLSISRYLYLLYNLYFILFSAANKLHVRIGTHLV